MLENVYLLTLIVVLLLLFAPQWGLVSRWRRKRWLRSREAIEDALMHLHQREHDGRLASVESLAGTLGVSTRLATMLVQRMESRGLLRATASGLSLTPEGHRLAIQVVRAHRLFERYLAYETSVSPAEVHELAHRMEHSLTPQQIDQLDAYMGHPISDPHGDPIPSASGEMLRVEGQSLVEFPVGKPARIVHLEDEPSHVYAQIVAEGLRPGMAVRVIERSPTRIVLESDTDEHILAPVVAANITVRESLSETIAAQGERLGSLQPGERATVLRIDDACQGLTRRRFLDLGITPGAQIEVVMRSAFSDPVAYRVRDTLIALRREQADWIWVKRNGRAGPSEEEPEGSQRETA
ncbi:MAG: FeoA domain-containing protein [Armatimonadota bacterium]|nr:FeoA domain-containing protein [bacterium]MDW8321498.1 FeoA domain-containing protein [Armatimonadota bacterium]